MNNAKVLAALIDDDPNGASLKRFFVRLPSKPESLDLAVQVLEHVKNRPAFLHALLGWATDALKPLIEASGTESRRNLIGRLTTVLGPAFLEAKDSEIEALQTAAGYFVMRAHPALAAAFATALEGWLSNRAKSDLALFGIKTAAPLLDSSYVIALIARLIKPLSASELEEAYGEGAFPHIRSVGSHLTQHGLDFNVRPLFEELLTRTSKEAAALADLLINTLEMCAEFEKSRYVESERPGRSAAREDDSIHWWNQDVDETARHYSAYDYPLALVSWLIRVLEKLRQDDLAHYEVVITRLIDGKWAHQWRLALIELTRYTDNNKDQLVVFLNEIATQEWDVIWFTVRHEFWQCLNKRCSELTPDQLYSLLTNIEAALVRYCKQRKDQGEKLEHLKQHQEYASWLILRAVEGCLDAPGLEHWKQKFLSVKDKFKLKEDSTLAGGSFTWTGHDSKTEFPVDHLEHIYSQRGIAGVVDHLALHPRRRDPEDIRSEYDNTSIVQEFVRRDIQRVAEILGAEGVLGISRAYISSLQYIIQDFLRTKQAPVSDHDLAPYFQAWLAMCEFWKKHQDSKESDDDDTGRADSSFIEHFRFACADIGERLALLIPSQNYLDPLIPNLVDLFNTLDLKFPTSSRGGEHGVEWGSIVWNTTSGQAGLATMHLAQRAFIKDTAGGPLLELDSKRSDSLKLALRELYTLAFVQRRTSVSALFGFYSAFLSKLLLTLEADWFAEHRAVLARLATEHEEEYAAAFIICMVLNGGVHPSTWPEFQVLYLIAVAFPKTDYDKHDYFRMIGARCAVIWELAEKYEGSHDFVRKMIDAVNLLPKATEDRDTSRSVIFKEAYVNSLLPTKEGGAEHISSWSDTLTRYKDILQRWPQDSEFAQAIAEALNRVPDRVPLSSLVGLYRDLLPVCDIPLDWHLIFGAVNLLKERIAKQPGDYLPALHIAVALSEQLVALQTKHRVRFGDLWLHELRQPLLAKIGEVTPEISTQHNRLRLALEALGIVVD